MPEIDIKITNLPQIRRAFGMAPSLMTRELNLAIKKTIFTIKAKEIGQYSSLGIRVVTGGLISSIQRGEYFGNLVGEVGPNVTGSPGVRYSIFVHNGTRYMQARPFLKNAMAQASPEVERFFTNAVQNVLNDIGNSV